MPKPLKTLTTKPTLADVGKLASTVKGKSTVPPGDVRLTVNLAENLHLRLKLYTVRTRTNMSDLVGQLIREHLDTVKA